MDICAGKPPFKRLIYPMPETWGLGVHLTLDLEGRARFGPDVEWIDKVEYKTSPEICDKFYPVIRQYWPGLPDGSLRPSYSGIRPKVNQCSCTSHSLATSYSKAVYSSILGTLWPFWHGTAGGNALLTTTCAGHSAAEASTAECNQKSGVVERQEVVWDCVTLKVCSLADKLPCL